MIRDNCDPSANPATGPSAPQGEGCRAHRKLTKWQVRRYEKAIDENKWYMSERLGRAVAWSEAEDDFLHNGYYGCAPKWRKEYCAHHCSFFVHCRLGQLFAQE